MSKPLAGAAIVVGAFVALTLTLALVQQQSPTHVPDVEAQSPQASDSPDLPRTPSFPSMTRDQFERIHSGMAHAECMAVAQGEGLPLDPAECQAKGIEYAYAWHDPDGRTRYEIGFRDAQVVSRGFGATPAREKKMAEFREAQRNATTVIQEQEAARLEQAAIRDGRSPVITVAEFARIRTGMTYDQCVAVIGAGNPMADQYAAPRNRASASPDNPRETLREAYVWQNPGGYHAEIAFLNGRVTSKCWKMGPADTGGSVNGSSPNAP